MAELFSNFADFKQYVGGRVNQSVELDSLASHIYEAARRHITPYLGQTQYTALLSGSLSGAQTALLPFIKRPLALLTLYEYSKIAGIEFGESGMHRIETQDRKSAYRYQEKQYQLDCLEKGYEALEIMLKFLDDGKATYTEWAASEEAKVHRTPLLNYASDFRRLTHVQCDRYTFEALRPIISEVQTYAVQKALPSTFWSGFQSRHLAGTLTTEEKALREIMRKAIAHKAMEEATKLHWIQLGGGRVFVSEEFGEQSQVNRTMPNGSAAGLYIPRAIWADRHSEAWKAYIMENASSFTTVFDTASGGSNSSTDAWHIATTDEADAEAIALDEVRRRPVFRL